MHSVINSAAHPHIQLFTDSLTHSLTYSLTHSLLHSLENSAITQTVRKQISCLLTHSLTHSLINMCMCTPLLTRPPVHSGSYSLTHPLTTSFSRSLSSYPNCLQAGWLFVYSLIHSLTPPALHSKALIACKRESHVLLRACNATITIFDGCK